MCWEGTIGSVRFSRGRRPVKVFLRDGKLVTLMLGHLTVDSYVGVIPVLYPLLIGRFEVNFATVGLVSLAYSGAAAVFQPLFGILADRYGTRLTGLALVWTAITFALVGFVPSFQVQAGIHELIETFRRRGVRIVHEVLEVSHGWVAFISDLDGNVLQIYQAKGGSD